MLLLLLLIASVCSASANTQTYTDTDTDTYTNADADKDKDTQTSSQCQHYSLSNLTPTNYGYTGALNLVNPGPYGGDVKTLQLFVYFQTQQIVRIKIIDPTTQRWEVPYVNQMPLPTNKPQFIDYNIKFQRDNFGFSITRVSNGEVLFNTSPPADCYTSGMIYEDNYLEMTNRFQETNPNLYGLGERVAPLRLQNNFTYTLFAKDQGTPVDLNLYGSHPFYMHLSPSGNAFGAFLLNSNAMDVVMQPRSLTYKVIGGVFDFFFFMGPTPESVVQQYSQVIGTPYMPSYWSLGWHQCRWGYKSANETFEVIYKYAQNNIPLETMWNDIDYMNMFQDFTLDPVNFPADEMKLMIEYLHTNNQHYIMIIDPGINTDTSYAPYNQLLSSGGYITRPDGSAYVGKVWPGFTIFPDFFNPATTHFWQGQLAAFHDMVQYDGIWIDMNEVSSFCNGDVCSSQLTSDNSHAAQQQVSLHSFDPNNPPYLPGNVSLDMHTINLTCVQYGNMSVYNTHNLYGYSETMVTVAAAIDILQTRATVISRSTFPGSGHHAGHWLGDNNSEFADMYYSIPGILNMNMFGIPMVGADICGFGGNTTAELCARWMQLGNFYPFSRNHNAIGSMSQEPYTFNEEVTAISIAAINGKYTLLPFYYTLFYQAHALGTPVVRPLFFEFPNDPNTYALDTQFLVGTSLLVSPVLDQGATAVVAYFPAGPWYDYFNGTRVPDSLYATLVAPLNVINVHMRGGSIIPTQPTSVYNVSGYPITTTIARTLPLRLLVAIDNNNQASGQLYVDDGISPNTYEDGQYTLVNFQLNLKDQIFALEASIIQQGYADADNMFMETVTVYGAADPVTQVMVDGHGYTDFTYEQSTQVLSIINLKLPVSGMFVINWYSD
ncbi:hypothetical protein SAMD00019534_093910 [Acytostelium subglobosum LB1]|uniref:hypothetical protein n=1 Tax=Acytostelium subglobosum LB1 TaxID=1410327 RepID=UPI0006451795|nr:hypothetical protein SAMD00019534_093910 [Acytostelium subglobosum LB1]GAM26216.1 hypothetical protein SAMD00019534_093910 [Acytostelium subglobosum LB1]|eukprot:XP_012750770.1 hypothetical protein SAMD00019534_093910 [Acytostelium subglobosum LB1]